ncbi:MAG: hypothetical protein ACRECV_06810 [Xanthobacteraceae bacterium]
MASAKTPSRPGTRSSGVANLSHALQRLGGAFAPAADRSELQLNVTKTTGSPISRSGIYIFLISSTCVYYLLNASILVGHYDLGWHLAAGDLIRDRGHIPFHDPWSFTAGDRQWFNLEWLWGVCASALFQHTHFVGLVLFVVACGAAIVGYLTRACLGSGASTLSVSISVLSACLLYPEFSSYPNIYLAAAPNIATMVFSVVFYKECLQRTKRVLFLPAVMLLWANLHGGFLLGLGIIGVFAGIALLKRDWANCGLYGIAGGACFAVTFINPLGWHIYEALTTVLGHFSQKYITEWWPYYRNMVMPGSIPGIIYILTFVVLELRYRRACPIESRMLSWLFLFLGLYQFRYMSFFFLFSTIPLALNLDRLLPRQADDFKTEKSLLFAGIALACALPLVCIRMPALGLPALLSKQDVHYLETHYPHARLLNHWNYGGILIFWMRGAIPVFVDGRAATAYPNSLLHDYFALVKPDQLTIDEAAWDRVLAKYKINTVLWPKSHEQLRHFLVDKEGWKETYTGAYAAIYVKP